MSSCPIQPNIQNQLNDITLSQIAVHDVIIPIKIYRIDLGKRKREQGIKEEMKKMFKDESPISKSVPLKEKEDIKEDFENTTVKDVYNKISKGQEEDFIGLLDYIKDFFSHKGIAVDLTDYTHKSLSMKGSELFSDNYYWALLAEIFYRYSLITHRKYCLDQFIPFCNQALTYIEQGDNVKAFTEDYYREFLQVKYSPEEIERYAAINKVRGFKHSEKNYEVLLNNKLLRALKGKNPEKKNGSVMKIRKKNNRSNNNSKIKERNSKSPMRKNHDQKKLDSSIKINRPSVPKLKYYSKITPPSLSIPNDNNSKNNIKSKVFIPPRNENNNPFMFKAQNMPKEKSPNFK